MLQSPLENVQSLNKGIVVKKKLVQLLAVFVKITGFINFNCVLTNQAVGVSMTSNLSSQVKDVSPIAEIDGDLAPLASEAIASLKRIVNKTTFPLRIILPQQQEQLLKDGSRIALKSTRENCKQAPFLQAVEVVSQDGVSKLVVAANSKDAFAPETQFKVSYLFQPSGTSLLRLESCRYKGNFLQTLKGSEDVHIIQLAPIFAKDDVNSYSWIGMGDDLSHLKLKNVFTQGLAMPQLQPQKVASGPMFLENNLLEINNMLPSLNQAVGGWSADLSNLNSGFLKNWLNYQVFYRDFINSPNPLSVDSQLRLDKINRYLQAGFLQLSKKQQKSCCYGDIICLTSANSFQNMSLSYSGTWSKFCGTDPLLSDRLEQSWFVIKGPHAAGQRYNCVVGKPVPQGAKIRLEHLASKQNLTVNETYSPLPILNGPKQVLDYWQSQAKQLYGLGLAGLLGIGDEQDDWLLTLQGDTSKGWMIGQGFSLTHVSSNARLSGSGYLVLPSVEEGATIKREALPKQHLLWGQRDSSGGVNAVVANQNKGTLSNSSVNSLDKKAVSPQEAFSDPMSSNWVVLQHKPQSWQMQNLQLLRTGFPQGASFDQDSQQLKDIEYVVQVISQEDKNSLPPKADYWFDSPLTLLNQQPIFEGIIESKIDQFDPGSIINLPTLEEKGVVWNTQLANIPDQWSCVVQCKPQDSGNLQFWLSNTFSPHYIIKLIVGDGENSSWRVLQKLNLSVDDVEIVSVTKAQDPDQVLPPGNFCPVWLSYNHGKLFAGRGTQIGKQLVLAANCASGLNIDRVGFSGKGDPVSFSQIVMGPAWQPVMDGPDYASMDVGVDGKAPRLRQVGAGVWHLQVTHRKKTVANFILQNAKQEDLVKLQWDFVQGQIRAFIWSRVASNWRQVGSWVAQQLKIDQGNSKKLDINLSAQGSWLQVGDDDEIWLANLFYSTMQLADAAFLVVDDSCKGKVRVGPPAVWQMVQPNLNVQTQAKLDALLPAPSTGLLFFRPFRYQVLQHQNQLMFIDQLNHNTVLAGQVKGKGTDYTMMFSIEDTGLPKMRWLWEPENSDLLKLNVAKAIVSATSEALTMTAMHTSGVGAVGNLIGTGVGMALLGTSIPLAYVAGMLQNKTIGLLPKSLQADQANADVKIDWPNWQQTLQRSAQVNRDKVESLLSQGTHWVGQTMEKWNYSAAIFLQVLDLVNQPYVIKDRFLKDKIFNGLDDLYQTQQELHSDGKIDTSWQQMQTILTKAITNPYLLNLQQEADLYRRQQWLGYVAGLIEKRLNNKFKAQIPALYGEALWLSSQMPKPGNGLITLALKGSNDAMLMISAQAGQTWGGQQDLYQIIFGANNNQGSRICLQDVTVAAAESDDASLLLSDVEFLKYWVNLKDGKLSVGYGEPSLETMVYSWTDPYAKMQEICVGISSWDSPITLKEVQVEQAMDL